MKSTTVSSVTTRGTTDHDKEYRKLFRDIQARPVPSPLFSTNATGLWDAFLAAIPADVRQHYTCNACRHFVEKFGGVVTLGDDATPRPVIWPDAGKYSFFRAPIVAVLEIMSRAKVTGVFLSPATTWGTPKTGEWSHLSALKAPGFQHSLLSADQAMAEKREEFLMLQTALSEFGIETARATVNILSSDALYRSEKCLGAGEWFLALHELIAANPKSRTNICWAAVAAAPVGFAHIRSTMIGTLLEDVQSGLPFDSCATRFREKMHPLRYQRPQALPSEGNIAQAEKIIEKLGIARALDRRFARFDEVQKIWTPAPKVESKTSGSVFDHLRTKPASASFPVPEITLTWEKFREKYLSSALSMTIRAPRHGDYTSILTATHDDAPHILRWANPFSWYFYNGGSRAADWGLDAEEDYTVAGIALTPALWNSWDGEVPGQSKKVFFLIDGCKDKKDVPLCLFPEILRSDLHAIRATIERFSSLGRVSGSESASAAGLALGNPGVLVRVTTDLGTTQCLIKGWD